MKPRDNVTMSLLAAAVSPQVDAIQLVETMVSNAAGQRQDIQHVGDLERTLCSGANAARASQVGGASSRRKSDALLAADLSAAVSAALPRQRAKSAKYIATEGLAIIEDIEASKEKALLTEELKVEEILRMDVAQGKTAACRV